MVEGSLDSKCIFFLGAGFSADAGVPTQRELLPRYLHWDKSERMNKRKSRILEFLSDIFSFEYVRPGSLDNDKNTYPLLEDIFSAIDSAVMNGEYLGGHSPSGLREVRKNLAFGILDLIDRSVKGPSSYDYIEEFAEVLTDWRLNSKHNDPFSIITTNWDIILLNRFREYHDGIITDYLSEKSISSLEQLKEKDRGNLALVDFCLYTHPLRDGENHVPSFKIKCMGFKNIKLLYLHGSPTWLYCRRCRKIFSPPAYDKRKEYKKDALASVHNPEPCPRCCPNTISADGNKDNLTLSPILIMPTYYKIVQNVHLLDVWQNAAMELQEAHRIYFIGYSLPEADYLIRNLLISNIRDDTKISILGRDGETEKNYKQLFGKRIREENNRVGNSRIVVKELCEVIEEEKNK